LKERTCSCTCIALLVRGLGGTKHGQSRALDLLFTFGVLTGIDDVLDGVHPRLKGSGVTKDSNHGQQVKDQIRRLEEGEWELIKISRVNLAYVLNQTQHTSLLARPRPQNYFRVIGPWNRVSDLKSQQKHNTDQTNPCSMNVPTSHENGLIAAWIKNQGTTSHYSSCRLTHILSNTSRARPKNPLNRSNTVETGTSNKFCTQELMLVAGTKSAAVETKHQTHKRNHDWRI
jgi:hypothetical protein